MNEIACMQFFKWLCPICGRDNFLSQLPKQQGENNYCRDCDEKILVYPPAAAQEKNIEAQHSGGVAGEPGAANKQSDAITLWKRYAVAAQNDNALKWLRDNDKLIRAVIA